MSQRFQISDELNRMDSGLMRDAQEEWGTTLEWFHFDESSEVDDLFDVGAPREWAPSILVPVLFAVRRYGSDDANEKGLDTLDTLQFAVAKTVLRDRFEWFAMGERADDFLRDRVRYEGMVFTITSFQLDGQLLDRDVVIGVQAVEVAGEDVELDYNPATEHGFEDQYYWPDRQG